MYADRTRQSYKSGNIERLTGIIEGKLHGQRYPQESTKEIKCHRKIDTDHDEIRLDISAKTAIMRRS